MIDCAAFAHCLARHGVRHFTGVPDSLLGGFCAYLLDHCGPEHHVIAANEGCAVALGMGHHLATGEIPLVYLQNSGLGNAINPLLTLADAEVYGVPILLLIGWRGEPGCSDEPQHRKQGRVLLPMLEAMELPYALLEAGTGTAEPVVAGLLRRMRASGGPGALVARRGTFAPYPGARPRAADYPLSREQAIQAVVDHLPAADVVVASTGMIGRELFALRERSGSGHTRDFLVVGGMGHAGQIAMGLALSAPGRRVWCLDGDGAALMHLGALTCGGTRKPGNFRHVLLNNGVHDSVGGQPTVGFDVDFARIARGCGYPTALRATNPRQLRMALSRLADLDHVGLLEVRVRAGHRSDLGRPTDAPAAAKDGFMDQLR